MLRGSSRKRKVTSVVATSTYGSSRKKVARSRTSTVLSTSVSPPPNALSGFAVAHAYSVGGKISTSMYSTAPQITTTGNSAGELSGLTPHVVTTDVTNSYRSQPQVICNNVKQILLTLYIHPLYIVV